MKTNRINRMLTLIFAMTVGLAAKAQTSPQLEVPGDNFSLEGALDLFKKSASPEEFEKLLNAPDSKVNNLDLNGDGYIDYIRVIDRNEGNIHAFIMQAVVSDTESQDVAVISLEKQANGKAVLQIIGDEDVYGVETIIEPTSEVRTYGGTTSSRVIVNVWAWPSVQYIYGPYYSAWISPWGWNYRPMWWHTWRPIAYYDYYPYWSAYHPYYSVCYTHRIFYAQQLYRPYRVTSVIVHNRHNNQIAHYRSTRNDYNGRNRYDRDHSGGRQNTGSIRYDANGRLAANADRRANDRSAVGSRTRESVDGNRRSGLNREGSASRSGSDVRSSTNTSQQRSTGMKQRDLSDSWSSNASRERTMPQREEGRVPQRENRPAVNAERNSPSGTPGVQRSTGNPGVQRSVSPNVQRSMGSPNVQRSTSSPNVQRSTSSPNVQRSTGNPGVQRSAPSVQRSSGNPGAQRSGVGSSGKSSGGQRRGRQ